MVLCVKEPKQEESKGDWIEAMKKILCEEPQKFPARESCGGGYKTLPRRGPKETYQGAQKDSQRGVGGGFWE